MHKLDALSEAMRGKVKCFVPDNYDVNPSTRQDVGTIPSRN